MPALAYMPFYTADFLADENVSSMTFAERGLYITLLCHAWREGSIPGDVAAIARLVQRPIGEVRKVWLTVAPRFTPSGDRLVQRRMETVRGEVSATAQRRSDAGKKGAEQRWKSDGPAIATAMATEMAGPMRFDGIQSQSQIDTDTTCPSDTPYPPAAKVERARKAWLKPSLPRQLPSSFPVDVEALKPIAGTFLDAFGNARSNEAIEKNRPAYVDVLATLRSRGVSVAEAWHAFGDARLAHDGKPLFGAAAKTVLSYLPQSSRRPAMNGRSGPYDGVLVTIAPEDRR